MTRRQSCQVLLLAGMLLFSAVATQGRPPEQPNPVNYEFQPDTGRLVAVMRKDATQGKDGILHHIGHLDMHGTFIEDRQYPRMKLNFVPIGIPRYEIINLLWKGILAGEEEVYEFRSGSLIKGRLDAGGNFIPKIGSRVIAFTEYQPGPNAIRIWNLPGKFVEVKRKDPQQKR